MHVHGDRVLLTVFHARRLIDLHVWDGGVGVDGLGLYQSLCSECALWRAKFQVQVIVVRRGTSQVVHRYGTLPVANERRGEVDLEALIVGEAVGLGSHVI